MRVREDVGKTIGNWDTLKERKRRSKSGSHNLTLAGHQRSGLHRHLVYGFELTGNLGQRAGFLFHDCRISIISWWDRLFEGTLRGHRRHGCMYNFRFFLFLFFLSGLYIWAWDIIYGISVLLDTLAYL